MKIEQRSFLFLKLIVIVWAVFVLTAQGETTAQIVKGELEEHTETSVKVGGWHYSLCRNMENSEHKGIYLVNKKNEEVSYKIIDSARDVQLYINPQKRCVWKIKVLRFYE